MTQADLAEQLGLSRGYVSRVVNGETRPSIDRALAFSKVLDVPVEELFGRDEGAT